MKIETIEMITEDSVMKQIRRLESAGFYLHDVWYRPQKKHKGPQGPRPIGELSPHSQEIRRAYWRRKMATLRAKYNRLKWQIVKQHPEHGGEFMSFEEWSLLWRKAGSITLGDGSRRLAWQARGRSKGGGWAKEPEHPQLRRWDLTQPFRLSNVYVAYKEGLLADGERLSEFFSEEV